MECYAYSSLHDYGIAPVGLFGYGCDDPSVKEDIDRNGIPLLGKEGEIDMEKLAEMHPDAVLGYGTLEGWGWLDESGNKQLLGVAPFVPLSNSDTIDGRINENRQIAAFFGGDVESDKVKRADEELKKAKEAFQKAVAGTDLKFLFVIPTKEMLYSAKGFAQPELFAQLGAHVAGPEKPENDNPWAQVAWEDASSYPADVIFVEGYDESFDFDGELWHALPAVKAGQLSGWEFKGATTAMSTAKWLNDVTQLVSSSKKVA